MFFDSEYDLLRVLVLGTLGYTWLLIIIRLTGKRTLAQLNAFDLIVSVALGSTLASVLLSSDVALAEGAVALALLCVLQLVVALLTSRSKVARRTITARPTLLVRNGELLDQAMRSERISRDSLLQVVRSQGVGGLELVAAVVLETNGRFSVITREQQGSGSALTDVPS
jgi:uncharacterized membrane protein YcaP (DUF421 family)